MDWIGLDAGKQGCVCECGGCDPRVFVFKGGGMTGRRGGRENRKNERKQSKKEGRGGSRRKEGGEETKTRKKREGERE